MVPYQAHDMTPGLVLGCHWDCAQTSGPNCINWQGRRASALLLCMLKRSPMVLRPESSMVIMQRVYCDPTATPSSSWGPHWALGDPSGLSCAIWWPLGRSRSPGWSQLRCDRGITLIYVIWLCLLSPFSFHLWPSNVINFLQIWSNNYNQHIIIWCLDHFDAKLSKYMYMKDPLQWCSVIVTLSHFYFPQTIDMCHLFRGLIYIPLDKIINHI